MGSQVVQNLIQVGAVEVLAVFHHAKIRYWQEAMMNDRLNAWWVPLQMEDAYHDNDILSFNVTGWWNGQSIGTINGFLGAVNTSDDPCR